jgi:hypothetical protein
MSDICKKIAAELKNQYVIGYKSTNTAKDGAWRKIRVKVSNQKGKDIASLNVRAKTGYYAPSGMVPSPARSKLNLYDSIRNFRRCGVSP